MQELRKLDRLPRPLLGFLSWVSERLPYSAYGKNFLHMISRDSALMRYFEFSFAPYFMRRRLLEPKWMLPADLAFLTRTFAERR